MPGEHLCQPMAQAASESAAFFRSGLVSMRSGWNLRVADALAVQKARNRERLGKVPERRRSPTSASKRRGRLSWAQKSARSQRAGF